MRSLEECGLHFQWIVINIQLSKCLVRVCVKFIFDSEHYFKGKVVAFNRVFQANIVENSLWLIILHNLYYT